MSKHETLAKKIAQMEEALGQAFTINMQLANAITRLEGFTFGLIKLLKDANLVDLDRLSDFMVAIEHHEDLHEFWVADVPVGLAREEMHKDIEKTLEEADAEIEEEVGEDLSPFEVDPESKEDSADLEF